MREFWLAGLCYAGPKVSSILIPYFTIPGTNQTYVQDLDEVGRISRFCIFDANAYADALFIPPPTVRRVGEVGIVALKIEGSEATTFAASDAPAVLQARIAEFHASPFLLLEVSYLLKDPHLALDAARLASRQFSVPRLAQAWLDLEIIAVSSWRPGDEAPDMRSPEFIDPDVRELEASFSAEDWSSRWCKAWTRSRNRDELAAIGIRWLLSEYAGPSSGAHLVISNLIGTSSQPAHSDIVPIAVDWLMRREFSRQWGDIAHKLMSTVKLTPSDNKTIAAIAVDFLYDGLQNSSIYSSPAWSKIFKRLWDGNYVRENLVEIGFASFNVTAGVARIARRVVSRILIEATRDDRLHDRIEEWFSTRDVISNNIETRVLLYMLRRDKSDMSVIEVALGWLERRSHNSTLFKDVWDEVIASQAYGIEYMLDIAEIWVLHSSIKLRIWPAVLIEVLEHKKSLRKGTYELSMQWMLEERKGSTGAYFFQRLREALASRSDIDLPVASSPTASPS